MPRVDGAGVHVIQEDLSLREDVGGLKATFESRRREDTHFKEVMQEDFKSFKVELKGFMVKQLTELTNLWKQEGRRTEERDKEQEERERRIREEQEERERQIRADADLARMEDLWMQREAELREKQVR